MIHDSNGREWRGGGGRGEGRWDRSLRLSRAAWDVVRHDRTLLALTAIGAFWTLVAMALLFGLAGLHADRDHYLLWSAVLALPSTFVATFFNVAAAASAAAAFDGGHLTLREALAVPAGRIGEVLLWSVLAAGVGTLLDQLAERLPFGGRLATWLAGVAWGVATFFVVPILALEGCRGTACVRRSSRLIQERWGEGVGGFVAITFWTWVVTVPAGMMLGVGVAVLPASQAAGVVLIALGGAALLVCASISGTVVQVFKVALYRYALDPTAPVGRFARTDLDLPFKHPERPTSGRRFGPPDPPPSRRFG